MLLGYQLTHVCTCNKPSIPKFIYLFFNIFYFKKQKINNREIFLLSISHRGRRGQRSCIGNGDPLEGGLLNQLYALPIPNFISNLSSSVPFHQTSISLCPQNSSSRWVPFSPCSHSILNKTGVCIFLFSATKRSMLLILF